MAKKQKKQEALSVSRLINEVLVAQLSIPFRQIVNDTTFSKYTGSKRPDILISEFEYDGTNDEQYIKIICVPTAPWATGPRLLPNCHFIFIFFVQILAPLLGRERILRHYVPQNDIYGRCSGKIEKIFYPVFVSNPNRFLIDFLRQDCSVMYPI